MDVAEMARTEFSIHSTILASVMKVNRTHFAIVETTRKGITQLEDIILVFKQN